MTESTKDKASSKKPKAQRSIPHHTLKIALSVPRAIQKGNKGKPWSPILIAKEMDIKPKSNEFRNITSSSFKYGLTVGSWRADKISLTPFGSSLLKPLSKQKEMENRQQAVLNVKAFTDIYNRFKNKELPSLDDTYFRNILETELGIPQVLLDECIQFLRENGTYAGILSDVKGALFVTFEGTPPKTGEVEEEEVVPPAEEVPPAEQPPPLPEKPPQIFLIHGKNKTPLEQLKKILTEFGIAHKVAVDEPHGGRPVSKKVADLMRNCTSAIVIFTADEKYTDTDGVEAFKPSDNTVYELGAASILYGTKIVILKEKDVSLASDFKDLGYISFEKDKLKAKAMDLIKELVGFGFLKITPA